MEKVLLVDGSNLLFQMFYGMPNRILSRDGRPIHGTVGFVGALLRIIRMVKPTHMAVFFDGECENSRKQLDEAYKANRTDYSQLPEEEVPFSQLPDIFRALDVLGIPWAETTCCETDDWMASYAKASAGREVVLCSQDSDYFQLITDTVRVLRYRGEKSVLCDRAWVREKLGIEPERYGEYKALVGDTADNIPGVPKVGPKTAAVLINSFPDLQTMLENTHKICRPAIGQAIRENARRLQTNLQLIRLDGTAAVPFPVEALAWQYTGQTTSMILRAIDL